MTGLSERSKARLQGVHPDLVRVVETAANYAPFFVTEGLRSKTRQAELVRKGASRTMNSRHLTGHAVDLADMDGKYDAPDMIAIEAAMKRAARECNVPIECGIDWGRKPGSIGWDSPHYQLTWKAYPGSGVGIGTKVKEIATAVAKNPVAVVSTGVTVGATNSDTVSSTVSAIPAVPDHVTEAVTNITAWQSITEALWTCKAWAAAEPFQACFVVVAIFLAGSLAFLRSSEPSPASSPSEES